MKGDGDKEGKAVKLLQELYRLHDGGSDLPLRANRGYGGWQV